MIKDWNQFNEGLEKSEPIKKEVDSVIKYLKNKYKINEYDLMGKSIKSISIDGKNLVIKGHLKNKTYATNKLYNVIEDDFKGFSTGSIRKGIKDFLNMA